MAKRSRVITMAPLDLDQEDDLSYWEIVNTSDAEYSDDSLSVDSLPDEVISWESESESESSLSSSLPPPQLIAVGEGEGGDRNTDLDVVGHVDDDHVLGGVDYGCSRLELYFHDEGLGFFVGNPYGHYGYSRDYDEVDDDPGDDEVVDDDDYDLDDELMPRSVTKKLGRQRMRKLGKRVFSKVMTSKTSPYSHLKPGCVRGKHGLGMKFRC